MGIFPTPDGKGRRACVDILINSPLIQDLIRKGKVHEIKALMGKSAELGMQTFDQALFELYKTGEITYEDALAHADSSNDLRLMIKLGDGASADQLDSMAGDLSIEMEGEDDPGQTFGR